MLGIFRKDLKVRDEVFDGGGSEGSTLGTHGYPGDPTVPLGTFGPQSSNQGLEGTITWLPKRPRVSNETSLSEAKEKGQDGNKEVPMMEMI